MKLHTTTVGDGPRRAALVHGLSSDGGTWFELAPWIAGHGYAVTLVDQRGHGASPRAPSYGADELADDLVETLPAGLDVVLGHSLGGRALTLAAQRLAPARAVYLDPGWDVPPDLVLEVPLRPDGSPVGVAELAQALPGRSRAHLEQAAAALAAFDPAAVAPPNVPLPPMSPPTRPVVPSLLVVPEPSLYVTAATQERLRAGGWSVRTLPGADHDLHVLDLARTRRALEGWL